MKKMSGCSFLISFSKSSNSESEFIQASFTNRSDLTRYNLSAFEFIVLRPFRSYTVSSDPEANIYIAKRCCFLEKCHVAGVQHIKDPGNEDFFVHWLKTLTSNYFFSDKVLSFISFKNGRT